MKPNLHLFGTGWEINLETKKSVWIPEENGGFAEGTLQFFHLIWYGVGGLKP